MGLTMNNVAQYLEMMDLSGQGPTMQNIGGQRDLYNQNMTAIKALGQQALTDKPSSPLQSLADALRKNTKPNDPYALNNGNPYGNAQTAMNLYGAENVYGYGGQGQIPAYTGEM
jgi:hypothetical protein